MGELYAFDLQPLIKKHNLEIYFETGTGKGVSLRHALKYPFVKYYSVDIDNELIEQSLHLKKEHEGLVLIKGFSKEAITNIVPNIAKDSPVLFFLDAHFPGADFHKISYEQSIRHFKRDAFPLIEEIESIKKHRDISKDAFIIDDLMIYEDDDYESKKEGCTWKYRWLQEELGLETDANFLYDAFADTHNIKKDLRHQGYLVVTPKTKG